MTQNQTPTFEISQELIKEREKHKEAWAHGYIMPCPIYTSYFPKDEEEERNDTKSDDNG